MTISIADATAIIEAAGATLRIERFRPNVAEYQAEWEDYAASQRYADLLDRHGIVRLGWERMLRNPIRARTLPDWLDWMRSLGRGPWTPTPVVPQGNAATIDQLREYGSLTVEQIAPWIPLLRRYAAESGNGDLHGGVHDRTDESTPETHNSLAHLFLHPAAYPTTLGRWFPDWLEGQHITEPEPLITVAPTLLEGAPMITLDTATALANDTRATLVPDHIEDYRADYDEFVTYDRANLSRGILSMDDLLDERNRGVFVNSARLFMQWMRENNRGPFAPASAEAVPQGNTTPVFDFNQPMHLWPYEQREAILPDVVAWAVAVRGEDPGSATSNFGHALNVRPHNTGTTDTYWANHEYEYLGNFRRAVREGTYTLISAPLPQGNELTVDMLDAMDRDERVERYREDLIRFLTTTHDVREIWANTADATSVLRDFRTFSQGDLANANNVLGRFAVAVTAGTYTLIGQEVTTDTTAPTGEQVILPIGPTHPDWERFAQQMADVATRNGMCPEYDRIARLMGLPTRKTRIVTRITLDVPVVIERGNNVDDRALREAAKALLEQSGSVNRSNRTEVERQEIVAADA